MPCVCARARACARMCACESTPKHAYTFALIYMCTDSRSYALATRRPARNIGFYDTYFLCKQASMRARKCVHAQPHATGPPSTSTCLMHAAPCLTALLARTTRGCKRHEGLAVGLGWG